MQCARSTRATARALCCAGVSAGFTGVPLCGCGAAMRPRIVDALSVPFRRLGQIGAAACRDVCRGVSGPFRPPSLLNDERVEGDAEVEVELSYHLQGQGTLAVEDLGDSSCRPKDREQIPCGWSPAWFMRNLMASMGSAFGRGSRARSYFCASIARTSSF